MSEEPKVDAELIRSVLPGMATGVVSRLHSLTGQPATIVMFVVDVEGNLHGTNNFTSNQDMEAFVCALADGYREKNAALLEQQRKVSTCQHVSDRVGDDMYACIHCGVEMNT